MKANAEGQAALASQANKTAASTQASQPSRQAQSTPALPKPPTGPGKTPKDQRDKKRAWSKAENAKKLEQQGGKCAQCGEAKTADEVEGHHIERHADGGQTDDPNHAALCNPCHIDIHKP
jgi:5-methylcytosine-specific restriction endonuclease McrA